MKKKRLIPVMVLGLTMMAALAFGNTKEASAAKYKDYKYIKRNDGIMITQYNGKEATVKIPGKINGKKVTSIGYESFADNEHIKKVVVPDSIKTIKVRAFKGCKKLKSIKLSKNLASVKSGAFKDCTALEKVNFPAKVKVIESECFSGCKSLKKVSLTDNITSIPTLCFKGCSSITAFSFSGIDGIEPYAFEDCTGLKGELDLSDLTEVGRGAFGNCTAVTGVKFSDTLQIFGGADTKAIDSMQGSGSSNPFGGCTSLMNIDIPATNVNFCTADGVVYGKSMEWLAAYPAGRTGEYTVSDKVKGIGESAFEGSLLTKINIPDSVKYIFGQTFKNSAVTSVRLPDYSKAATEYCGKEIFDGCSKLESFAFPEGMKDNSIITLSNCTSLRTVTFPSTFTELKGEVFKGCTSLNNVELPSGVVKIPTRCFFGCTSLSNINLTRVENFGIESFYGCTGLTGKLDLAAASEIRIKSFAECSNITEVALSVSTSAIGVKPYVTADERPADNKDEVDLENGVIWNKVLENISIDTDSNAFAGCSSLERVTVPENNEKYISVDGCLYSKDMRNLICVPAKKTGKFAVPYNVYSIAPMAFFGSNVDSIVLSNSVKRIDVCAFAKCAMKSLTISKSLGNIPGTSGMSIFTGCRNLAEINVKSGNAYFTSKDGVLYRLRGSKKELVCYPAAKKGKEFKIPKKCDIYGGEAFNGCKYLKKIVITPESGIKCLPVIAKNCNNVKVYLSSKVKMFRTDYNEILDTDDVIFGINTKKCKVYVKKNSKLIKKLKAYDIDYKGY